MFEKGLPWIFSLIKQNGCFPLDIMHIIIMKRNLQMVCQIQETLHIISVHPIVLFECLKMFVIEVYEMVEELR